MLATRAPAQGPRVELAFGAGAAASSLPAIAWLCGTVLPLRSEWPDSLPPETSFVVSIDDDGISIAANEVALPGDALIAGSVTFGNGLRALCACTADGAEDWYVARKAPFRAQYRRLLHALHALDLDRAHSIDLSVAVGHKLGATASGDLDRETIQLGAALCGVVTWQAWHDEEYLRVRGRSDGGLLLPAVMLLLADKLGNGTTDSLPLRAFVTRDGDREEAVRQMSRFGDRADRQALVAMLHGADELRLTAIDSLVRIGATDELPRIVGAASPTLPLATTAAVDAVATLWRDASEATRQQTRAALAASSAPELRALDLTTFTPPPAAETDTPLAWKLLMWLLVMGAGLFTFWLRERSRLGSCV